MPQIRYPRLFLAPGEREENHERPIAPGAASALRMPSCCR
ncbi:hypothetical protein ASZ90_011418 [hydrocarbon metagenome]|uniref:Uncharacterized protein n=1 Tax=hydrocarbon metagenome TaxID=938273 RepID=A0A0W8FDA7_9ZZZZ